jgi:hypothetical protein
MSRTEKIGIGDLMLRHLRMAGDAAALTIPVGTTTVADARRQLVLKTFASTGGDVTRTAKLVGVPAADVRAELLTLLDGSANNGNGLIEPEMPAPRKPEPSAPPPRAAAKGKAKKK